MGASRGAWGHVTPEKFEILILSKAILVFGEGDFFLKRSLNQLFLMPIVFFACFHIQVLISVLSTLCYVFLCIYHKNSFENIKQMSKSGFFLTQSHIGQDLGFSSKIERIPTTRDGWTIC